MAGRRRRTLRRRSSGTRRTARRSGDGRTQKARATKEKAHPTSRSGPTNNPGRHGAAGTRSATSSAPARTSNQLRELQQLRHRMDLLTTLVLRHDNQLNINAQDTAYMIFVRTDIGNLGSIMYEAGKKWNEVKETNPEKLESPMRVVLMQKLLLTRAGPLYQGDELGREEGAGQRARMAHGGWQPFGSNALATRATETCPVPGDQTIGPGTGEAMAHGHGGLERQPEGGEPFYATRTMAETYESPTLSFMLDVGLRTKEANLMWTLLQRPGPLLCVDHERSLT